MSVAETKYVKFPPPRGEPLNRLNSTTAATHPVPPDWWGEKVTFVASTGDLVVRFGDGGVTVSESKVALLHSATGTLAPHGASGFRIPAGSFLTVDPKDLDTHFAVVSSVNGSGYWSAYRSSGNTYAHGTPLPMQLSEPALRVLFEDYAKLSLSSSDIASIRSSDKKNYTFSEGTNRPAWTNAANTNGIKAAASFTSGNSDVLKSTDAALAAVFGGASAFTLFLPFYLGATGALQTLFSAGTAGSNNGRFDITINASNVIVVTRVDSAGVSTTSTGSTTTFAAGVYLLTYVYDGAGGNSVYVNRAAETLTGSATGNLATLTSVSLGARGYNTSTVGQFMTGELYEAIAWDRALSTAELGLLHPWALRRYGK